MTAAKSLRLAGESCRHPAYMRCLHKKADRNWFILHENIMNLTNKQTETLIGDVT